MEAEVKLPEVQNEYTALFYEYKMHKISKDEFYMTLYTMTIRDEIAMREMRYEVPPVKPEELYLDERTMKDRIKLKDKDEQAKERKKFYEWAEEKFPNYYKEKDRIIHKNISNKVFLTTMYDYLKDKNKDLSAIVKNQLDKFPERLYAND